VTYRVVLTRETEKILDRLDRPTEQRIRTRFANWPSTFRPEALCAADRARRDPGIPCRGLAHPIHGRSRGKSSSGGYCGYTRSNLQALVTVWSSAVFW